MVAQPEDVFKWTAAIEVLLNRLIPEMLGRDEFATRMIAELADRASSTTKLSLLDRIIQQYDPARHDSGSVTNIAKVFQFRNKVAHSVVDEITVERERMEGAPQSRYKMQKGIREPITFEPYEIEQMVQLAEESLNMLEGIDYYLGEILNPTPWEPEQRDREWYEEHDLPVPPDLWDDAGGKG